jgi:hypothetical protein
LSPAEILLTSEIYTRAALEATSHAFQQVCSTSIDAVCDGYVVRFAEPVPGLSSDVVAEFLNYALALSAQEQLG